MQNDLLDGIAKLIAAAGIAAYDTTGSYLPTDTAIYIKAVPPTPDRIVTLTAYGVDDNATLPMSRMGVQVRVRGTKDARDVDDLGDSIFQILHGLVHTTFGSVSADQILRKQSVTLGVDDSKRWSRADTYYVDLADPPTVNRPSGGSW
jgi:hypothetical protein